MKLFSTSCEALFLGWDAPLLPKAVTALRQRFTSGHQLDLSSVICTLPSGRSTRRLGVLLESEAEVFDLQYKRPLIITVGQLADHLYDPPIPSALEFEQTLAWARVLRQMRPDDLYPLLPTVPPAEPIGPWLELAGTLRRLHEELAANRLSFREAVEATETDAEKLRWKLLTRIFDAYRQALSDAGLADPHWSRSRAVLYDQCRTDRTVILIGTSDLSDSLIAMLRSLDSDLISMVAAPPSEEHRFDEFGCVDTPRWVDHQLPIEDRHLISAGDIADQAIAVAESVAKFADRYAADSVTIGVTDESQVGPVEVELRGCGVSTYRHLGWTVSQTSIGRLLDLTGTFLQRRNWQSLAALVRHADVSRFVTDRLKQSDSSAWLTELDQLLANHFPIVLADDLPDAAVKNYPLAVAVSEFVQEWLSGFLGPDQSIAAQPIASWSAKIGAWLEELYGAEQEGDGAEASTRRAAVAETLDGKSLQIQSLAEIGYGKDSLAARLKSSSRTELALHAARNLISRFASLNDELDLTVSGSVAVDMLASRLGDVRVLQTAQPNDVEILGWLDLALDDAPAMTIVGLNHPFVPGAVTNDPFLPGALRTKLRMADNDRRYARDVYAMHLMLSARQDIRFIVGKTAADRSPTPPSRLLAAAPTEDAARRVRQLLGKTRQAIVVEHRWDRGSNDRTTGNGCIPIPKLDVSSGASISTMSVTAFRDYLTCPYRFYLRHVLKLRPLDDASSELAANQFGDLVHAALEWFGESDDRDESNAAKIEAMLLEQLYRYADEYYGDAASTAVGLQVVQAERRLKAVARQQAVRAAEGWKIHASEASVGEKEGAGILVDDQWMGLRGRFDRIDHHPASGRWAILDYKTHGHRPEKKHLKRTEDGEQWIDLQLPLYRMMIPFLGIDAPPHEVALGYFNVSEKDEETRINIADFSEAQMHDAEQIIFDCIRGIRAGNFEATKDRVQFDDYAAILQTGVASRLLDQVDEFAGEEVEA